MIWRDDWLSTRFYILSNDAKKLDLEWFGVGGCANTHVNTLI